MPEKITQRWIASAQIHPVDFTPAVAETLQKSADFFFNHHVLPKAVNVRQAFDYSLSAQANKVANSQEFSHE